MVDYFVTLWEDYENAEITCVILHNCKANIWFDLQTIIELTPFQRNPSPLIGQQSAG